MEYTLNSLNVKKDGSYFFVSKNGREYDIGNISTIQQDLTSDSKTYDILVILDFNAPNPDYPGETTTVLVNWLFGSCFIDQNHFSDIRDYVDEYEEKLFAKEKKEMKNYKTVEKMFAGDCRGSIYIDLMNVATQKICHPEEIKRFANEFWQNLYDLFQPTTELFVGFNESGFIWDTRIANVGDYKWFKIYEENGNQYADKIKFEVKVETIAKGVCINEAFDIMRKEIDENINDCKFKVEAYQQAYNGLEHYDDAVFTIINEEDSVLNSEEEIGKYIYKYVFLYRNEAYTINRISY